MPPPISAPFWQDTEWLKILLTAFVTVGFTEPVKVWLQNRSKLRQMRKFVMAEAVHNLAALNRIRELCSQNPDISERPKQVRDLAILTLRNAAYHKAQDDFYLFNRMPERAMIVDLYKNCEWLKDISIYFIMNA